MRRKAKRQRGRGAVKVNDIGLIFARSAEAADHYRRSQALGGVGPIIRRQHPLELVRAQDRALGVGICADTACKCRSAECSSNLLQEFTSLRSGISLPLSIAAFSPRKMPAVNEAP